MSKFPSEWRSISLDEATSTFFSNVDKKTIAGETPVRLCNYMDVYKNEEITKNLPFMRASAKESEITKFLIKKNDVLITKDSETPSDIAIPAYVAEDFDDVLCGYHLALIRPDKKIVDGKFLSKVIQLEYYRNYFLKLASGSTRFGLTTQSIHDVTLFLPPLPEQTKIAEILTSVDRVIDLTSQEIDKLKDIKKGMMQELLTKGIGHTKFKDSPVGKIPAGWECVNVGSLGSEKELLKTGPFGSSLKSEHFCKIGLPVINIQNLGVGEFINEDMFFVDEEKAAELSSYLVQIGDLVFSRVADIGRSVVVNKEESGWLMSSNLMRLRVQKDLIDPVFLMFQITEGPYIPLQLKQNASDGGRSVVNSPTIRSLLFPLPPLTEQAVIKKQILAVSTTLNQLKKKVSHLKFFQKGLMNDLLTGKTRVKCA